MSVFANIRFLVADDMTTMRKLVSQQLKLLGATMIQEASDGNLAKEVLEKALASKLPIQFVVSDWNMPNCTGIELLRFCRAHEHYKNVPFLLVTAEAEMSQVSEAVQAGVDNYVVKPFTPASFGQKLNAVYAKRFPK